MAAGHHRLSRVPRLFHTRFEFFDATLLLLDYTCQYGNDVHCAEPCPVARRDQLGNVLGDETVVYFARVRLVVEAHRLELRQLPLTKECA